MREHLLDVLDPVLARRLDLAPRGRPELRLHLAAEAAERAGGQHGLARAADADRQVVVRAADRRRDRRGHGAVLDQLDPCAGRADLLDQVVVAWSVEHDRGHVADVASEGLRDRADVVADRREQADPAARARPDGDRPHVHVGEAQELAGLGRNDHRDRAVASARDDAAALERVEREVDVDPAGAQRLGQLVSPSPAPIKTRPVIGNSSSPPRHDKYLPRDHLGGRVPNDAEIIIKIRQRENAAWGDGVGGGEYGKLGSARAAIRCGRDCSRERAG